MADTEKDTNTDIELDLSVLQNKGETYSSLTDLNGISLFTINYEDQMEAILTQKKEVNQLIGNQVFTNEMAAETGASTEELKESLFQSASQQIIKEENSSIVQTNSILYAGIGAIFCVFLLFMMGYLRRCRNKREDAVMELDRNFTKLGENT